MEGLLYGIIFFIGASVFSFINVLIYRIPRGMPFGNERSICPGCKTQLKGYDMIPVVSYLLLGGRCRNCNQGISIRYPLIEGFGGIVAIITYFYVRGMGDDAVWMFAKGVHIFLLLALLTAISFIDIDTMEIPNGLVLAVLVWGIFSIFLFPEPSIYARLIGVFSVSVPLLLITLCIPGAFGGGDIKLMAALGIFLGWKLSLFSFVAAVFLGGTYGAWLLFTGKKDRKGHFAFGPFLCIGVCAAIFFGTDIIGWYLGILS